jgi:ADP-heptose:LPS heptosyltransferase
MASAFFSRKKRNLFEKNFTPKKILLVRTDRIGDALISTPIFFTLRKLFPNAIITVLLSNKNKSSADLLPFVTNTMFLDKSIKSIYHTINKIRTEQFDVCINLLLNRSTTAVLATQTSGANYKIGFEEDPFLYDINIPKPDIIQNISITTQSLLTPFTDEIQNQLFINISNKNLPSLGKLNIGLNISAGSDERKWSKIGWISLAKLLKENNFQVSIICALKDKTIQEEIANEANVNCAEIFSSLKQFVNLINNFDIIITPDTSITHIASALKKKVVLLMSNTNNHEIQWSPIGVEYRVINSENGLLNIKSKEVFDKINELIN